MGSSCVTHLSGKKGDPDSTPPSAFFVGSTHIETASVEILGSLRKKCRYSILERIIIDKSGKQVRLYPQFQQSCL